MIHEDNLGCDQCPVLKMKDDCIENLRAKLDKTRTVIDLVHRMQLGQQLDLQLSEALKEYRGETK